MSGLAPTRRAPGVCDVRYWISLSPGRRRRPSIWVDGGLETVVLDRLNRLPFLRVYSVCAGHVTGDGDRQAHVIFQARRFEDFKIYCWRLSVTDYTAHVSRYRADGQPAAWYLEVRRGKVGQAPAAWWHGLVDAIEDNPDCGQWMSTLGRL